MLGMKLELNPKQGRVIVKEIKDFNTGLVAKGGLLLAPNEDEKKDLMVAKVVKMGKKMGGEYKDTEDETSIGQTVLFVKWSASEVTLGGETLHILRYEDIITDLQEVENG